MKKNFFKSILSTMLALMLVISCCAIPSSAAITLSKTSTTLTKGYATTLSVKGTTKAVTWTTGDKSVATVSSKGKVSGKGVGSTYIYAQVSNTTLKCKVTVVAGKIVAGIDEVDMKAGKTKKVNISCKGTHTISLSNSNRSVAYGTWNGAKFDGDIVPLTIKAVSAGTARIKIFAKNYPTVYAYIDVTVDGGETKDTTLQAQYSTADIDLNQTASIRVYSATSDSLNVQSNNTRIATATISSPTKSGNSYYSTVAIKGVSAGNATIRVSSKTNSKIYTDISVAVKAGVAEYYVLSTTAPTYKASNDQVLRFTVNYTTYYMLVPYNYDIAYTNSIIATTTRTYNYYDIYSMEPVRKVSTDVVKTHYTTTGVKYVLLPVNYDEAKYNTTIAKYTGSYEYYVIYNESPVRKVYTDNIETWTIVDPTTRKTTTRYLMYPYNYDANKVAEIKSKDNGSTASAQQFKLLDTYPAVYDTNNEQVMTVFVTSGNKFMIVPKNLTIPVIARMNDVISTASSGKVYYYQWYTKLPSNINTTTEGYVEAGTANSKCYLVYRKVDYGTPAYNTLMEQANRGEQMNEQWVRPTNS